MNESSATPNYEEPLTVISPKENWKITQPPFEIEGSIEDVRKAMKRYGVKKLAWDGHKGEWEPIYDEEEEEEENKQS